MCVIKSAKLIKSIEYPRHDLLFSLRSVFAIKDASRVLTTVSVINSWFIPFLGKSPRQHVPCSNFLFQRDIYFMMWSNLQTRRVFNWKEFRSQVSPKLSIILTIEHFLKIQCYSTEAKPQAPAVAVIGCQAQLRHVSSLVVLSFPWMC